MARGNSPKRSTYKIPLGTWQYRFTTLPDKKPNGKETWEFWQDLGSELGFDHKTVMVTVPSFRSGDIYDFDKRKTFFTALPLGHGRHWCFPQKLTCPRPASAVPLPPIPTGIVANEPQ